MEDRENEDYTGYPRLSDKKLIKAMIKIVIVGIYTFLFLKMVFLP